MRKEKHYILSKKLLILLAVFFQLLNGADLGNKQVLLFSEYAEWSLNNSSYSGNPFDLITSATFTHSSHSDITTEMFYDGNNTWKFRFTGVQTGTWNFSTSSSDPDLDGHTGTVTVNANPDQAARGFLNSQGQMFTIQSGDNGEVTGIVPNIWMNYREECVGSEGINANGWTPVQYLMGNSTRWENFLDEAREHGCNGVQILPQRDLMDMSTSANNPNLDNFRTIEEAIISANSRNMFLHIFMWGDEQRGWQPPDGLNSTSDLRLNRYLAARLGPLPGWWISLGFDLMEWAGHTATVQWHDHLLDKLGWYHLLGARKEGSFDVTSDMELFSTDYRIGNDGDWYTNTVSEFSHGGDKPMEYSRRFAYMRDA
ncbi:MAG: DUF5060 domain-containing protein, partial [Fibrobacterota bacterium]